MTRLPGGFLSARSVLSDGVRFLLAGFANTAVTLGIYQLLLFVVSPSAAYAISWVCGLVFVAAVYPSKVFGQREPSRARVALFSFNYAVVFVAGLAVLNVLSDTALGPRLSILFVLVATTALNFAIGRLLFGEHRR